MVTLVSTLFIRFGTLIFNKSIVVMASYILLLHSNQNKSTKNYFFIKNFSEKKLYKEYDIWYLAKPPTPGFLS